MKDRFAFMKLTFIADTHYYSKKLGCSGKAYELRSGSDQKCLAETGDIIDSAFACIAESDTDAVFILGDVSNDGEMISHTEFREKLYELKKFKPVYLITATHDWCCDENPRRFEGENVFNDVEVMKSSDLPKFYKEFGPDDSIDSFITKIGTVCYTVQLENNVRVLALNDDKNDNDHAGYTEECWQWIENQIANAKRDNQLLIGIQHHLLIPHISPLITGGSTCVENREYVASRLADAGLKYMFVGHSHIQATDEFVSQKGNRITEVNVGSLCGYPAPIANVIVNDDKTVTYNIEHLKEFKFNGKTVDAQTFLAKHATDVIFRVLECKSRQEFEERLAALQLNGEKLGKLWFAAKPILNKVNTALTKDVYRWLRLLGMAKNISKNDVEKYAYKPIKEFIGEIWLSALDGSLNSYSKDDSYYKIVMAVVSIPSKLMKNNSDMQELISAADYILTGGNINNQSATI